MAKLTKKEQEIIANLIIDNKDKFDIFYNDTTQILETNFNSEAGGMSITYYQIKKDDNEHKLEFYIEHKFFLVRKKDMCRSLREVLEECTKEAIEQRESGKQLSKLLSKTGVYISPTKK